MSDNIRVGLIGYGYASKTFHAPLIAGTPGLELAVISSSDETKVKADWPTVTVVSEPKHLSYTQRYPFPVSQSGA